MRATNTLVIASTNQHKCEEFRALLLPYAKLTLLPANEIIVNAWKLGHEERYLTYLENAVAKARLANQACHYPCLGDDSGLEVDALEGRPGIKSHRFAKPSHGITQDQANIELLLDELRKKSGAPRTARFICTLALVMEGILIHATGVLEGKIIDAPRGGSGFGYDPIFEPKVTAGAVANKTIAEMTATEKNMISHRAKAVGALMLKIRENNTVLALP